MSFFRVRFGVPLSEALKGDIIPVPLVVSSLPPNCRGVSGSIRGVVFTRDFSPCSLINIHSHIMHAVRVTHLYYYFIVHTFCIKNNHNRLDDTKATYHGACRLSMSLAVVLKSLYARLSD